MLAEVDAALFVSKCTAIVVIVNDGGEPFPKNGWFSTRDYKCVTEFRLIDLVRNLGNQNALTIGLSFIRDEADCDVVIVMDSDGQDIPAQISDLLAIHRNAPSALVVAERSGRSEGLLFRLCYILYRVIFKMLIGRSLTFGNFSIVPHCHLRRLCSMAELPVNFAAALIKSRIPISRVPCFRGARYDGVSSQNIVGLIIHALNSILVFGEIALVRIALFSGILIFSALVGLAVVGFIRLFTSYAIPGWTSNVAGVLVLVIGQAMLFSLLATLVRGRNPISLIVDPERYKLAIASVTVRKHAESVVGRC